MATYAYDPADNRTGYTSVLSGGGSSMQAGAGDAAALTVKDTSAVDSGLPGEDPVRPCPFVRIVSDDPSVLVRGVCVATAEEAGLAPD